MRLTLDYHTPQEPRASVRDCLAFAAALIGVVLCISAPLVISVAGIYADSAVLVIAGAIVSGVCLAIAMLLAAAAIERYSDLRD